MLEICPGCLSPEDGAYCSLCGTALGAPDKVPLFFLKVGWSRSRDFERILEMLKEERGYRYVEQGEELVHIIPVPSIREARALLIKYEKALKWKETSFELVGGKSFSPLADVSLCFMRLIVEGVSPCREGSGCPFSRNSMADVLEGSGDDKLSREALRRLFLVDLLDNQELLFCPFYRTMVGSAASAFDELPKGVWSFYTNELRHAMESGHLIIESSGETVPMLESPPEIEYDFVSPYHIPRDVSWGLVNGGLEMIADGNSLVRLPYRQPVSTWDRAASVLETTRGRFAVLPDASSSESEFVVLPEDPDDQTLTVVGPFPIPWSLDPLLASFAFVMPREKLDGQEGQVMVTGDVDWNPAAPVFWIMQEYPIEGEVAVVRLLSGNTAWLARGIDPETRDRWERITVITSGGRAELSFIGVISFQLLGPGSLAVLWGKGRKISFWNAQGGRQDHTLLFRATELFATVTGNLIVQFEHAILEMSPNGEILDYRSEPGARYHVSSQGYLRVVAEEDPTWHFLEHSVIEDMLPQHSKVGILLVRQGEVPERPLGAAGDMFIQLLALLKTYSTKTEYRDKIRQLWQQAPRKVQKDLRKMDAALPWLLRFRKNKTAPWLCRSWWLSDLAGS
ncbi:hypothetical protein KKF84_06880 [Myxococcota bacterium]|nr:hypothetical protein [Myxococcota bacterium]